MPKAKGKKGKKKSKKDAELSEPPHDAAWERAVESGVWDRPPDALPDASVWPTWGAYRERILTSAKEVNITWHASLRDEFAAELIKLSPPNMKTLTLHGSDNLTRFVVSPIGCCPSLTDIDLASCSSLKMVMIQSKSVKRINISRCPSLNKVLIQCPNLVEVTSNDVPALQTLIIWSDTLSELDVSSSKELYKCELYCPKLKDPKVPPIRRKRVDEEQMLPDIANILQLQARKEADMTKEQQKEIVDVSYIPKCYR